MIHNIEENGPYIVLTKGFALPHEGIDKGVRITGLNLLRLSRPVNFDAEEAAEITRQYENRKQG